MTDTTSTSILEVTIHLIMYHHAMNLPVLPPYRILLEAWRTP